MSGEVQHTGDQAGQKAALVHRLHRIEGQVRGVERMLADERPCLDILTQIAAANMALEALAVHVLDRHVRGQAAAACQAAEGGANASVEEILRAVERFARMR